MHISHFATHCLTNAYNGDMSNTTGPDRQVDPEQHPAGNPLTRRPFREIGQRIGIEESDVLERIKRLSSAPLSIIRQISAIFDSRALGYQSTLVACKIPEPLLDQSVSVINSHPGVSHNYQRNHDFNLWYTLAVPPNSQFGLEKTVQILHSRSSALSSRMLPTLKLYKIGVKFDFGVRILIRVILPPLRLLRRR